MDQPISALEKEPVMLETGWTVPSGYKHPVCPGCDYTFYEMRPEVSKGGASVVAEFLCKHCNKRCEVL